MKKFIEYKETIIDYVFTPVYENSKKIEVEKNKFKHKGCVKHIFFLKDIYKNGNPTGKTERIYLDVAHLKLIIKECEDIEKLEMVKEIEEWY